MARDRPRTVRFDLPDHHSTKHDPEDDTQQVLAPAIQFGSHVRIVGLVNQQSLNNAEGIVLGLNANGRCEVKVVSPPHLADAFQQGILIYPANLEPLPALRPAPIHSDTHPPSDRDPHHSVQHTSARRRMATNIVDSFFRALATDEFPEQAVECFFGITRPPRGRRGPNLTHWPLGHLTYAAWQALYQAQIDLIVRSDPGFKEEHIPMNRFPWMPGHDLYLKAEGVFKDEVVNALLGGDLLGWFRGQVEQLLTPGRCESVPTRAPRLPRGRATIQIDLTGGGPSSVEYLRELQRRGFEGVAMEPLPL